MHFTKAAACLVFFAVACTADKPAPPNKTLPSEPLSVVVPNVEKGDLRAGYRALTEAGLEVTWNRAFKKSSDFLKNIRRYARGVGPRPPYSWILKVRPRPGTELEPGAKVTIMSIMCPTGYYKGPCVKGERRGLSVDPTQRAGCDSFETDLTKEPNYKVDYIHRWTTEEGCDVRLDILMTRQGKNACGGERVADIVMGTPLGQPPDSSSARIYIKDPGNVFQDDRTSQGYDPDANLPAVARDSGYRQDGAELWTVPDEPRYIYLVSDDHVERWPQDETPPGCG